MSDDDARIHPLADIVPNFSFNPEEPETQLLPCSARCLSFFRSVFAHFLFACLLICSLPCLLPDWLLAGLFLVRCCESMRFLRPFFNILVNTPETVGQRMLAWTAVCSNCLAAKMPFQVENLMMANFNVLFSGETGQEQRLFYACPDSRLLMQAWVSLLSSNSS